MEASSDYFIEFLKFKCSTGCSLSPAFPFFPVALSLVDEEGEERAEGQGCSRLGWHRQQSFSSPWGFQLLLLPPSSAPRQELERAFPVWLDGNVGAGVGTPHGELFPNPFSKMNFNPGAGRAPAACP